MRKEAREWGGVRPALLQPLTLADLARSLLRARMTQSPCSSPTSEQSTPGTMLPTGALRDKPHPNLSCPGATCAR